MIMQKLLTIIVPSYNMEHYLDRCVSSLLSLAPEELKKTEVLIVNDGSTDATSRIAHGYQNQYPDVIKVIDKENGNYGSCINTGLSCATGKYIKVLDADDCFDVDAYSSFVKQLQTLDVDLVVTEYTQVDSEDKITNISRFCKQDNRVLTNLKSCNSYWPMHCVCYRTKMLQDHNYEQTPGISYTDTEWSVIPLLYVNSVAILPLYLYQYLVGRAGQTMEASTLYDRREQLIKTLTKCVDWINREKETGYDASYPIGRVLISISFLYYTLLIDNKGKECLELNSFDRYLQQKAPYAYEHLENDVRDEVSKFHYVQAWRTNNYVLPEMPWYCKIKMFVHKCRIHIIWLWDTKVRHRPQ